MQLGLKKYLSSHGESFLYDVLINIFQFCKTFLKHSEWFDKTVGSKKIQVKKIRRKETIPSLQLGKNKLNFKWFTDWLNTT